MKRYRKIMATLAVCWFIWCIAMLPVRIGNAIWNHIEQEAQHGR